MSGRVVTVARTLAAAMLVVFFGVLPVRAVVAALDPFAPYPGHTADYGAARPRAIRAALPAIAKRNDDAVLVFGSSGVARAFVPAVFDAHLSGSARHYVSYNLAQLLFQPETALAMAHVVRQTWEGEHERVAMTIFGISVPELSRDALRAARRSMPDQPFAFATAQGLWERAPTDPLGALGDGIDLLAFGNVRPERAGLWLEEWRDGKRPACNSGMKQPPDTREGQAALVAYCDALAAQFPRGVAAWNRERRGALDFGLPATKPMLERLIVAQGTDTPIGPPPRSTPDYIDPEAVRTIIAAIRELATVSRETFLLRDILNPAQLSMVPSERIGRWRAVAEQIARESGAVLLDLNDGAIDAADFGDRTHLNPLAAERFSSVLAARVRPLVEASHASR